MHRIEVPMKLRETPLAGAYLIEAEPRQDSRGYFARTFCQKELGAAGLFERIAQCNVSHNVRRGTLRGLHFQTEPHAEEKIVSCTRGAIFDVIVDLRPGSPTLGKHFAQELTPDGHLALYVPKGFAHGFQTLVAESTVSYLMSNFYVPNSAAGIRWDDPDLNIRWPLAEPVLSDEDAGLPTLRQWRQQPR
jgi:dTDP-4-dehydrorhamnose 3,5-epimerase